MHTIALIYLITTFTSVIMAVPQLKQLWAMKDSSEFNLLSWVSWLTAQLSALVYSISIHSIPYLMVNLMWVAFYIAMIGLIFKYRKQPIEVPVEAEAHI